MGHVIHCNKQDLTPFLYIPYRLDGSRKCQGATSGNSEAYPPKVWLSARQAGESNPNSIRAGGTLKRSVDGSL